MDLEVNGNSSVLKFDNFSEFQNAIIANTPHSQRYYEALCMKMNTSLTPYMLHPINVLFSYVLLFKTLFGTSLIF